MICPWCNLPIDKSSDSAWGFLKVHQNCYIEHEMPKGQAAAIVERAAAKGPRYWQNR
jgi:hypothetical protein